MKYLKEILKTLQGEFVDNKVMRYLYNRSIEGSWKGDKYHGK